MHKKLSTLILILCFSLPSLAYVVKPGETLASIVKKYYNGPVFGKDGGVAKLVQLNQSVIKDPNHVPPGTVIRLNKELLKPGVVDNNDGTQDDVKTDADEDADSAQGLNPYIEVEKYDDPKAQKVKYSNSDKINFFAAAQFNSFEAKDRTTLATMDFSTSSDTNVGIQYVRYISDATKLLASVAVNEYAMVDVNSATFTAPIEKSEKTQVNGALGVRYLLTPINSIDFLLKYGPHYYLLPKTNGSLSLEHTQTASVELSTQNYFYQNKDASVALNLGFEYITNNQNSGTGSTNSSAYYAGLMYQQEFRSEDKIQVEIDYKNASTDTTNYNLSDQAFEVSFRYSLPY